MNLLTPKGFLRVYGLVFVFLGVLGFIQILGPSPERSLAGNFLVVDNNEKILLVLTGAVALVVSSLFPPLWQRYIVMLLGVLEAFVGLYVFVNPMLFGMSLGTGDMILHLVIGAYALYTVFGNVKGGDK